MCSSGLPRPRKSAILSADALSATSPRPWDGGDFAAQQWQVDHVFEALRIAIKRGQKEHSDLKYFWSFEKRLEEIEQTPTYREISATHCDGHLGRLGTSKFRINPAPVERYPHGPNGAAKRNHADVGGFAIRSQLDSVAGGLIGITCPA
jgi:hypothetical protein